MKILKYYQHFHYQITNDFSPADCLVPSEPPAPTSHTKQQLSPKHEASVFQAVLKCTIWHYWAAMNPPKVFYNKRGNNSLAVAAATKWLDEIQQHYVLVCTQQPPNILCGCQGSRVARHKGKTSLTMLRSWKFQEKSGGPWTGEFGTELCGKDFQPSKLLTNSRFFPQLTSFPKHTNELLPSPEKKKTPTKKFWMKILTCC